MGSVGIVMGWAKKMKKVTLWFSFLTFLVTFTLNILSLFYVPLDDYEWVQKNVKKPIPGYSNRIRDISEIHEELSHFNMDFNVRRATDLVFESLVHYDGRRIDIRENWLLWGLGFMYEPISRTQDPLKLVSGGVAICSEAAEVLSYIAKNHGFLSRLIGLGGHVVTEIQVDSNWYLADADYGIVFPMSYAPLISLNPKDSYKIIKDLLLERGFGQKAANGYRDILLSIIDN